MTDGLNKLDVICVKCIMYIYIYVYNTQTTANLRQYIWKKMIQQQE